MPVEMMNEWIAKEVALGSRQANRMVLATAGNDGIPHSRIVAIREISTDGILFFTQRGTRKTREMAENPVASMTLWLPLQQREVMIDGRIQTLTQDENAVYWSKRPREMQLRFTAYSQTSGQPLASLDEIEEKYQRYVIEFAGRDIPMSHHYCGYRLIPHTYVFYTLRDDSFSDIIQYTRGSKDWKSQRLSP